MQNGVIKKLCSALFPLFLVAVALLSFMDRDSAFETRQIPQCQQPCLKQFPRGKFPSRVNINATTCSSEVARLGNGQKVIAFSYFEDETYDVYNRHYFSGIRLNLEAMKELYPPEYRMRLYYQMRSTSENWEELCSLACNEPQLDICDVHNNPKYTNVSILHPSVWRFLPLMDAQVDLLFSRDLDSILNNRELAAVSEFLADNVSLLHSMRDHPGHNIGILAGMWGVKLGVMRQTIRTAFNDMVRDEVAYQKRTKAGADQKLLETYVYRKLESTQAMAVLLSHDSYYCSKYPNSRPFPTRRRDEVGNYVGSPVVTLRDKINFTREYECPVQCRKQTEWIYC